MKMNEERRSQQVEALSDVLLKLCERNDRFIIPATRFNALRLPQITIKAYLKRIAKFAHCSEECFVLALIYIDRIIRSQDFLVNSYNVHRLVIASVMVAAKFFDDQYFNNPQYGLIGGVSSQEINQLEIEFLFMINFELFVDKKLYTIYDKRLKLVVSKKPRAMVSPSPHSLKGGHLDVRKQTTASPGIVVPSNRLPSHKVSSTLRDKKKQTVGIVVAKKARSPAVKSNLGAQEKEQAVTHFTSPLYSSVMRKVRHYPIRRCTAPSYSIKIFQASEQIHIH